MPIFQSQNNSFVHQLTSQTKHTDSLLGRLLKFAKWSIAKPQWSIPLFIGLAAKGCGAEGYGLSVSSGGTALTSRNLRSAADKSAWPALTTVEPEYDQSGQGCNNTSCFSDVVATTAPWLEELLTQSESSSASIGTRPTQAPTQAPTEAGLRLSADCRNSSVIGPVIGRVEVQLFGTWGTVCRDYFDNIDAGVVCRQLGLPKGIVVSDPGKCPDGTGPIHMDNVRCTGNETQLQDCSYTLLASQPNHYCDHNDDVAVLCSKGIRLVSNCKKYVPGTVDGRIELLVNGTWGTVCNDYFADRQANSDVGCRMLGLPVDGAEPLSENSCDPGDGPIYLDRLECTSNQTSLLDCDSNGIGVHHCHHSEDQAIRCSKAARFSSKITESGRGGIIQVWYNNSWMYVEDNDFNTTAAGVFCNELGFPNEQATVTYSPYDCTSGEVHRIQGIHCSGNEQSLLHCLNAESVMVTTSTGSCNLVNVGCRHWIRLSLRKRSYVINNDIPGIFTARPEAWYKGKWNGIDIDNVSAHVICRELGFPVNIGTANTLPTTETFDYYEKWRYFKYQSSKLPLSVTCPTTETRFQDCEFIRNNPPVFRNVALRCSSRTRFAPESNIDETINSIRGMIEVWRNGAWGLVDNNSANDATAMVFCREMGYPTDDALKSSSGPYHVVNEARVFTNMTCLGHEESLVECSYQQVQVEPGVIEHDYAAVRCTKRLRLNSEGCEPIPWVYRGRIEMWHLNHWVAFCTPDSHTGEIICSELRQGNQSAVSYWPTSCSNTKNNTKAIIQWTTCNDRGESFNLDNCIVSPMYSSFDCNGNRYRIIECSINRPISSIKPTRLGDTISQTLSRNIPRNISRNEQPNATNGRNNHGIWIGGCSSASVAIAVYSVYTLLAARKLKQTHQLSTCEAVSRAIANQYFACIPQRRPVQAQQVQAAGQQFPMVALAPPDVVL